MKVYVNKDHAITSLASVLNRKERQLNDSNLGEISLCLLDAELPGEVEMLIGNSYPISPDILSTINSLEGVVSIEEY